MKKIAFFLCLMIFHTAGWTDVPRAYTLASGDVVQIKVFGEDDLSLKIALNDEGNIAYPLLGELPVTGLTVRALERLIYDGLKGRYLINPKVSVSVAEYRKFFVNGEVNNPGGYAYIPGLTLRKAIALSGGMNERASDERIFIIHDGDKKKESKKADMAMLVFAGDIITVKEYKKIFVHGEVKKPGSYSYVPELTVRKAISLAGGLSDRGSSDKVSIIKDGKAKEKHDMSLDSPMQPGDILTVGERFF